ncbi:MAG: Tn3 family transposase [Deltaproteobacteria bacterium]|nr:Tn3 family transposase [Deltaproteobacteria bacterium]
MEFHLLGCLRTKRLQLIRAISGSYIIVGEWDECRRIFVSLALKETTQSTIVRKLSAQARNSRAKRAL